MDEWLNTVDPALFTSLQTFDFNNMAIQNHD